MTITRTLASRTLAPNDSDVTDYFNEDSDMLQRAMIQILFLDKGRLTEYRIGKYDDNTRGFYKRGGTKKPWSAVADEVWNIDRFVLGRAKLQCSSSLTQRQLAELWNQYAKIIAAGRLQTAINQSTPSAAQYATYRTTAVTQSGLNFGAVYTAASALDGVCKQEGTGAGTATHCYALSGSLYWNSVKIGENNSNTGGVHTYTDGGLGWGSIQPYNAGNKNLYDPQENMTKIADLLKSWYTAAAAIPGAKARVWHAVYGYHHGSQDLQKTPAQLRLADPEAAGYADNVFNKIGQPFTPVPQLNTDD